MQLVCWHRGPVTPPAPALQPWATGRPAETPRRPSEGSASPSGGSLGASHSGAPLLLHTWSRGGSPATPLADGGARADKLPSGSLGRVECRLELELHLPLPPGGEKGPVDRVVHHSYTACLHLGASSRKPSQIGPLASSSLVATCTRDIPMVAAGPWLCFWSQEVTAAQGLGRFSLGHKTRCVGSGEVCHLPVL